MEENHDCMVLAIGLQPYLHWVLAVRVEQICWHVRVNNINMKDNARQMHTPKAASDIYILSCLGRDSNMRHARVNNNYNYTETGKCSQLSGWISHTVHAYTYSIPLSLWVQFLESSLVRAWCFFDSSYLNLWVELLTRVLSNLCIPCMYIPLSMQLYSAVVVYS